MSKYYTPSIEEFRVGFEYEYTNDNGGTWSNYVMTPVDLRRHPYELTGSDRLRVKYLDREDIESLGFKIHDYDNTDSFTNGDIDIEINGYTDPLIIEIWTKKNMLDRSPEMVFKGTIKNKSELKNILKMIGHDKGE